MLITQSVIHINSNNHFWWSTCPFFLMEDDCQWILHNDYSIDFCAFSRSSDAVVTTSLTISKVWDIRTGQLSTVDRRHLEYKICRGSQCDRGERLFFGVLDDTVTIWNPFTGCNVHTLRSVGRNVTWCALSADGLHIAIITDRTTIKIWNLRSNICVRTLMFLADYCFYSLGGLLLICSFSMTLPTVWDPATGTCVCTLQCPYNHYVFDCAYSPRDTILLATTSSDKTVKLWNSRTGVCLNTLIGHESSVHKCAFFSDGVYLVTASADQTIRIWNVYASVCVHVMPTIYIATCCDISSDNALVVTSSNSCYHNTARVWRVPALLHNNVKLLRMILVGYRWHRLWLPTELWNWLNDQWFYY